MKVQKGKRKAYYYTCYIIRKGTQVLRQGTINGIDTFDAIERVYDMGRKVWKKQVLEVVIMDIRTGEVLHSSKMGDRVEKNLLDKTKSANEDKTDTLPVIQQQPLGFFPTQIGTYFKPKTIFTTMVFN